MTKEQEASVFLQRLKVFGISEEDFRRAEEWRCTPFLGHSKADDMNRYDHCH